MDPLILEALRFGTAILAGGIVAVIAQRIAFGHARKLEREDRAQRRRSTLAALAQELEENIARTGPPDRSLAPIRLTRSAWEEARGLELSAEVFGALRHAYALADDLNSRIGIMDRFVSNPPIAASGSDVANRRDQLERTISNDSLDRAAKAREAFQEALEALRAERR